MGDVARGGSDGVEGLREVREEGWEEDELGES